RIPTWSPRRRWTRTACSPTSTRRKRWQSSSRRRVRAKSLKSVYRRKARHRRNRGGGRHDAIAEHGRLINHRPAGETARAILNSIARHSVYLHINRAAGHHRHVAVLIGIRHVAGDADLVRAGRNVAIEIAAFADIADLGVVEEHTGPACHYPGIGAAIEIDARLRRRRRSRHGLRAGRRRNEGEQQRDEENCPVHRAAISLRARAAKSPAPLPSAARPSPRKYPACARSGCRRNASSAYAPPAPTRHSPSAPTP